MGDMEKTNFLLLGFSIIVVMVLIVLGGFFQGGSDITWENCCDSEFVYRADRFVYIARNFSSPITEPEIEDLKASIDQEYMRILKTPVNAGGSGAGGFSSPSESGNATVVSFGYFIDIRGDSHEWRGVTASPGGAGAAVKAGEAWYREKIREYCLENAVNCSGLAASTCTAFDKAPEELDISEKRTTISELIPNTDEKDMEFLSSCNTFAVYGKTEKIEETEAREKSVDRLSAVTKAAGKDLQPYLYPEGPVHGYGIYYLNYIEVFLYDKRPADYATTDEIYRIIDYHGRAQGIHDIPVVFTRSDLVHIN